MSRYSDLVRSTPGLIAYWRLGDTSGTVQFLDSGPNAIHAYTGGVTGIGQPGAIDGDSDGSITVTNSSLQVPYSGTPGYTAAVNPAQFTVEAWARPTTVDGQYHTVLMSREEVRGYNIYLGDNNRWQGWIGNGGWSIVDSGVTAQTGVWYHLVLTYDGSRLRFYVNGVLRGGLATGFQVNTSKTLVFGKSSTFELPFYGNLDDFSLYDRALTAPQVAQRFRAGRGLPDPSPRAAPGSGGSWEVETTVYKATAQNEIVEDLTDRYVLGSGYVDWNADRAIKLAGQATFRGGVPLDAYRDYIAVYVRMEREDGLLREGQVGLFTTRLPDSVHPMGQSEWTYDLRGLTTVVADAEFRDGASVAAGANRVAAVKAILATLGLTRVTIVPSAATTGAGITWPPGTRKLKAANDLLQGAGFLVLYEEADGFLASQPTRLLSQTEPFAVWTPEDFLAPPTLRPNQDSFGNVITVYKDNPNGPPLYATRVNDDLASPSSTVRLGYEKARDAVSVPEAVSQAELDAIADRLFEEMRSYYVSLGARVLLDPRVGVHESIDLAYVTDDTDLSGRYWLRTYKMGFDGVLECELNQTAVPFGSGDSEEAP